MKKLASIILTIFMTFSIGTTITACHNDNTPTTLELTDREKVEDAVWRRGIFFYYGCSIGGNQLQSSSVSITYLSFSRDGNKCYVSGKISATDIYGTTYSNTFDCDVTTDDNGETWKCHEFEIKNTNWNKN